MSENEAGLVTTIFGYTNINVDNFKYIWPIENFMQYLRNHYQSREFKSDRFLTVRNLEWCLYLNLKGNSISLNLQRISGIDVECNVTCSILNAEHQQSNLKTIGIVPYTSESDTHGFRPFVSRSYLQNLLPDGINLTIVCEVEMFTESSSGTQFHNNRPDRLVDDFAHLFENQKLSDVVLSVSNQEFQVHKAILAARSVVFQEMFENEMEPRSNRVDIPDMNYNVLHEMLRYIYTGRASILREMAAELLAAAHEYKLSELKEMCEETLITMLSIENAVDALILADLHRAEELTKSAIIFIKINRANFIETAPYMSLAQTHPRLYMLL